MCACPNDYLCVPIYPYRVPIRLCEGCTPGLFLAACLFVCFLIFWFWYFSSAFFILMASYMFVVLASWILVSALVLTMSCVGRMPPQTNMEPQTATLSSFFQAVFLGEGMSSMHSCLYQCMYTAMWQLKATGRSSHIATRALPYL